MIPIIFFSGNFQYDTSVDLYVYKSVLFLHQVSQVIEMSRELLFIVMLKFYN